MNMSRLGLLVVMAWFARPVLGAIVIPTSQSYVQDFNSIGTGSGNTTLPTDWKIDSFTSSTGFRKVGTWSAAGTIVSARAGASMSSAASAAMYNFGAGTASTWLASTERALGFLSNGSFVHSGNLYVSLKAPTGALSGLTISYDIEKYRKGTNSNGWYVQLYYSTDGATWTSAGPNFLSAYPADANNQGFDPAPGTASNVSAQLNVPIPANGNFYLAWNYSASGGTDGNNAQALAIDNISIIGTAASLRAPFVAWSGSSGFKAGIVVKRDVNNVSGVDWASVQSLQRDNVTSVPAATRDAIEYLREGLQKMTGQSFTISNPDTITDSTTGIILTTLAGAPASLQADPAVQAALAQPAPGPGVYGFESNEAYYIRSEANRVFVIANRLPGLVCAVADLLESVDYEVLGVGPNWTYVPNRTGGLTFDLEKSVRPSFFERYLLASQGYGSGTISDEHPRGSFPALQAPDEYVEVSYNRWRVGRRMRTNSYPQGYNTQDVGLVPTSYHAAIVAGMRSRATTQGFLTTTTYGLDAAKPAPSSANIGHLFLTTDTNKVYYSTGVEWKEKPGATSCTADLSLDWVRNILRDAMINSVKAVFQARPNEVCTVFSESEDGGGYTKLNLAANPNWYADYRGTVGPAFSATGYRLNGFKGINQPQEFFDGTFAPDVVYAYDNWLLKEFDRYVDSLPAGNDDFSANPPVYRKNTSTGKDKKSLIRLTFYSYNYWDVPPNFNLDPEAPASVGGPRMRIHIAGYSKHRRKGKWTGLVTYTDVYDAYELAVPNQFLGWRWSYAFGGEPTMASAVMRHKGGALDFAKQLRDFHANGRCRDMFWGESDIGFGCMGISYYLMTKVMWNAQLSDTDLGNLIDQWHQRAYGSGWQKMREYYDLVRNGTQAVTSPHLWSKALVKIDEAYALVGSEPDAKQRIDELKQWWYHFYFIDTNQRSASVPAFQEFVWKGQMSYQVTQRYNFRDGGFGSVTPYEALANSSYPYGPARYTAAETAAWWNLVKARWPYTAVTEFNDPTVDQDDLVQVAEFGTDSPTWPYFANALAQHPSPIVKAAAGQTIGCRMFWPSSYGAKEVFWGVSLYNTDTKQWEKIVDETTNSSPSVLTSGYHVVTGTCAAPAAGLYKFEMGSSESGAAPDCNTRVVDLNWNVPTLHNDAPTGSYWGPMTYNYASQQATDGGTLTWFYLPKGTTTLDYEHWNSNGTRTLTIYCRSGSTWVQSRSFSTVPPDGVPAGDSLATIGIKKIPLTSVETASGCLASFSKVPTPYMYSAPMIWAKSKSQLMVPRVIAVRDGLTIVP